MELYLVRHGVTRWNQQGKLQGHSDIELTEEGRKMAEKTAEGLLDVTFDAAYSSPLSRAYETASIILGKRPLKIQKDERIMEIGFGELEGADYTDVSTGENSRLINFYRAPLSYEPPAGGESFVQLCARAEDFLRETIARHLADRRILVVAHNGINQAMLRFLEGRAIDDIWKGGHQDNCAVAIVEISEETCRVIDRNRVYY